MIIPTFSNYAPKADLAGSFLGGARVAQAGQDSANEMQLGQQRLAQQAQQAQQEVQLAQQRIQAQQVQAQMELQAKQQVAQQQAMQHEQRLMVEKAEQDARLGLEQQRVAEAGKIVQMRTQQAAQKFQAQQAFQKESQDLIAGGMDPNQAFSQTAMKYGPMLGVPGSVYSRSGIKAPGGADFGAATPVEGLPEGFMQVQTGPGTRRILKVPDAVQQGAAEDIPGLPGKKLFRGKVYTEQESADEKSIRRRISALETAQDKDPGKQFSDQDVATLSKGKQMLANTYKAREAEINKLKSQLKGGSAPTSVQDFEGKPVRIKRGPNKGKLGRVINGEFVPDQKENADQP